MSSPDPRVPKAGYVSLLRNREYVGLLLSSLVSMIGDQLAAVALTVLVFERTNSPLLASATYAATFLPVVIGAPLLGGLADRMPRRRVLVAADLIRAGLFGVMALPGLPIWLLLGILVLAVTVEAPWSAARSPLVRDVLADDEAYQLGTSVDETLNQSGQILGFVVAGMLLVVFTPSTALLLDAVSFVGAAIVLRLLVRHHESADPESGKQGLDLDHRSARWSRRVRTALADAGLGFRVAMAPACRRPLLLTWAAISMAIAAEALAVPWGHQIGAGTLGIGLLYAAYPAGAVVGLLLVGRVTVERGQRLMLPLTLVTLLPLTLVPFAPSLPWALVPVFVSGIGTSFSMLARVAFVRGVDNAYRGRAFAIAAAGVTAGQGLGVALAGATASLINPAISIALSATLGLVLVGLAVMASSPPRLLGPMDVPVLLLQSVDPDAVPAAPWPAGSGLPPTVPILSDEGGEVGQGPN